MKDNKEASLEKRNETNTKRPYVVPGIIEEEPYETYANLFCALKETPCSGGPGASS